MSGVRNNSSLLDWLVDFAVLGVTFYVSCMLFAVVLGGGLFFQIIAYSTIMLVFVRLSKRAFASHDQSFGEITRQILGNATGIMIGTCVVLLLEKFLLTSGQIFVAVIFASVMAFFILGTLLLIVQKSPLVHK